MRPARHDRGGGARARHVGGRRCAAAYDLAMLDLDGVVYIGGDAVPGAPDTWRRPARRGCGWRSSPTTPPGRPTRSPSTCASSGVEAEDEDVVTSAQAAARVLRRPARRRRAGGRARAARACERRSPRPACEPVRRRGRRRSRSSPATARTCAGATIMRARGADPRRAAVGGQQHRPDHPDARSASRPGTASWSTMLRGFAGVEPVVAGKPERPLLDETVRRVGGDRPLMVGDRLDTDIEGATPRRARLAAGDDRRDRARRRWWRRRTGAAADVRRADLGRPARAARRRRARRRRRGIARRLDGRRSRTGGSAVDGRRRADGLVAGGRGARPGRTSTTPASRSTLDAPSTPRRAAGSLGRMSERPGPARAPTSPTARRPSRSAVPHRGRRAVDDGDRAPSRSSRTRPLEEHVGVFEAAHDRAAPRPRRADRPADRARLTRAAPTPPPRRRAGPPRAGPLARARQRADRRRAGAGVAARVATKPATGVDHRRRDRGRATTPTDPTTSPAAGTSSPARSRRSAGRASSVARPPLPRRRRLDRRLHRRAAAARAPREVVAVDVGYGQLAWSLQQDERVVVLDRTNVRDLTPS